MPKEHTVATLAAIEIQADRVLALEGDGRQATAGFTANLPEPLTEMSVEKLAGWLKEQWANARMRSSSVVGVLPRKPTTIRAITAPICPDEELPPLVQYTYAADANVSAESVVLDYQGGPVIEGQGREVKAVAVDAEYLQLASKLLHLAGLKCRRWTPRPYAQAKLLPQTQSSPAPVAVVALGLDVVEVTIWDQDYLSLHRALPVSDGNLDARVTSELKRTMAAFYASSTPTDIRKIVLIGPQANSLSGQLTTDLSMRIETLTEPVAMSAGVTIAPMELISLAGAIKGELHGAHWPVDLANPKRPAPPNNTKQRQLVLAAAVALLVPMIAYSYFRAKIKGVEAQIQTAQSEQSDIVRNLAKLQPVSQRYKALESWLNSRINCLDELHELSGHLPDTSQGVLDRLEITVPPNGQPAVLRLEGYAASQQTILNAEGRIAQDAEGHYKVQVRDLKQRAAGSSTPFPVHFGVDLQLVRLKEEQWTKRRTAWPEKSPAKSVVETKRRQPVALKYEKKTKAEPATEKTDVVVKSEPTAAPASDGSAGDAKSKSRSRSDRGSEKAEPSSTEASATSESNDPVSKWLSEAKGLSFEEREKKLKEAPSFLQKRLREKLKEFKDK